MTIFALTRSCEFEVHTNCVNLRVVLAEPIENLMRMLRVATRERDNHVVNADARRCVVRLPDARHVLLGFGQRLRESLHDIWRRKLGNNLWAGAAWPFGVGRPARRARLLRLRLGAGLAARTLRRHRKGGAPTARTTLAPSGPELH